MLKLFLSVYGILLLSGAYFGLKAGSRMSLIMGLVTGVLVLFGVYYAGIRPVCGYGLTAGVSGLLIVVFLLRFLKTQNFMPSGMLLLASAAALVVSLIPLLKK